MNPVMARSTRPVEPSSMSPVAGRQFLPIVRTATKQTVRSWTPGSALGSPAPVSIRSARSAIARSKRASPSSLAVTSGTPWSRSWPSRRTRSGAVLKASSILVRTPAASPIFLILIPKRWSVRVGLRRPHALMTLRRLRRPTPL